MTKKDGDKLREMRKQLQKMSDDYYVPVNVGESKESASMEQLATGIQLLLAGNNIVVRIKK